MGRFTLHKLSGLLPQGQRQPACALRPDFRASLVGDDERVACELVLS
jgi:hypothetical protein